nr:hypothetical protein [Thauera phenylacetica]
MTAERKIVLGISVRQLGEAAVVHRHVAIAVEGSAERHARHLLEQSIIEFLKLPLDRAVIAGVVLLRGSPRYGLVAGVEDIERGCLGLQEARDSFAVALAGRDQAVVGGIAEPEAAGQDVQHLGVFAQDLRYRRRLVHAPAHLGSQLGHPPHERVHPGVVLVDALDRPGDIEQLLVHLPQAPQHRAEAVRGSLHDLVSPAGVVPDLAGFRLGAAHQREHGLGIGGDHRGRRFDLFRELAHLVGDDREAAPRFAGPSGFDGRIEREQIGLVGDVVDQLPDVANLHRALAQFFHRPRERTDPITHLADVAGRLRELFLTFADGGEIRLGGGTDRLRMPRNAIHRFAHPATASEDLAGELTLLTRARCRLADAQIQPCRTDRDLRPASAQFADDLAHRDHDGISSAFTALANIAPNIALAGLERRHRGHCRTVALARGHPERTENGTQPGNKPQPRRRAELVSRKGDRARHPDERGDHTERIHRQTLGGHSDKLLKASSSDRLG